MTDRAARRRVLAAGFARLNADLKASPTERTRSVNRMPSWLCE
jgi:hypothetical protein